VGNHGEKIFCKEVSRGDVEQRIFIRTSMAMEERASDFGGEVEECVAGIVPPRGR